MDTLMTNNNLKIVIAIACVAGVIMVILLIAIVAIIRQQRQSTQADRKYNHMPKVLDRSGVAGEMEKEGGKKKKEVSFDNAAMEVGENNDSFTIPKNKDVSADDTDSACSIDMSNADSGRGSNDEFPPNPPEQTTNTAPNDAIPSSADGIPIRTGGLDPGSYYQGQGQGQGQGHRDISKLFTRDILYRDSVQNGKDRPPKIPERAPRSSQGQGHRPHVYGPQGDLYTTPGHIKPRARLPSDSSSSQSTCPVHSSNGNGHHGHSHYVNHSGHHRNGQLPNQVNLPRTSTRNEELTITGVIDSEIHV